MPCSAAVGPGGIDVACTAVVEGDKKDFFTSSERLEKQFFSQSGKVFEQDTLKITTTKDNI